MGSFLRKGGVSSVGNAFQMQIRCAKCGSDVNLRVSPAYDLNRIFEEREDGAVYEFQKEAVDSRCFRKMKVTVYFDGNRNIISKSVENGSFVGQVL